MKNYLWINPVAAKMYGEELPAIQEQLEQKGYILVSCEQQLSYVEQQYKEYAKTTDQTILDCRCPESIKLLDSVNLTGQFAKPQIEPILLRTSRVLHETYVKEENDQLIITCPCTQLRDFTREQLSDLRGITCLTWKEFIEQQGMKTLGPIEESPIPLGFFRQAFDHVLEVSGKEEIINEVKAVSESKNTEYDVIEMLYCKDGCNNGNGI